MNTFIELDKYGSIKWLQKANFTIEQMGSKKKESDNRICSLMNLEGGKEVIKQRDVGLWMHLF